MTPIQILDEYWSKYNNKHTSVILDSNFINDVIIPTITDFVKQTIPPTFSKIVETTTNGNEVTTNDLVNI